MNEILKSVMRGAVQGSGKPNQAQAADPMTDILKGILGGGSAPQQQSSGGLGDLIGGILGGGSAPQPQQRQSSGGLGDLIGGILGGGSAPQPEQRQSSGGIEDLIGGILGGSSRSGAPQQSGGLGDLIGAILGGGSGGGMGGLGSILGGGQVNPVAKILADKLGISPQMAQMAVTFFMSYFMQKMVNRKQMPQPAGGNDYQIGRAKPQKGDLDLDDLFEVMGDGNALQSKFQESGMANQMAQATGMDAETANQALQEIVNIVGEKRRAMPRVQPKEVNLKGLLDGWDN